jgi:YD repeat-containing protein
METLMNRSQDLSRRTLLFIIAHLIVILAAASSADAQMTYHLHTEASTTAGLKQLKTAGPDVASVALQTANLKSTSNGEKLIKEFDTQAGVPGVAGVNGMTFTIIPPPTLTSATPPSAHVNDSVTIAGNNFLASQGSSTITFNGTTATPTSWTNTSIAAPVPVGATTCNITVTVSNQASNGLSFTVLPPSGISGTVTRVTGGTPIVGATVQAILAGVVAGSVATNASGGYAMPTLNPGTYDLRVIASGFSNELRQGIVVTASAGATVNVAMYVPGAVSGKVTQADGVTPIAGAAVTVYLGPVQKGSASTKGTGNYTISSLHPGSLTARAANAGNHTSEQGVVVSENATTTKNFSLALQPAGPVLYADDALGRLVQVTDPSGDTAIYRYDAVGNITAIERPSAGGVAISGFTPTSGPVGTVVTISGVGFSATPGLNTNTLNQVRYVHRRPIQKTWCARFSK